MVNIKTFKLIFWDFDGVIKDSVDVKTHAYFELFKPFGSKIAKKVKDHHQANGGISRFDKLPIYLQWAGIRPSKSLVIEYSEKFSKLVTQKVIDSPWVGGVEFYIHKQFHFQVFVLISATPQEELEYIVDALGLKIYFVSISGAPMQKHEFIRQTLIMQKLKPSECLVIGDSQTDLDAANINQVPFLLRKHYSNKKLSAAYAGNFIEDFIAL